MPDLQELIIRGRFVMGNALERLRVFEAVNGKRNTAEIAKIEKRHINNVRRDLSRLEDAGLIQPCLDHEEPIKKNGFPVYEKVPLARTIPLHYFSGPSRLPSTEQRHGPSSANAARQVAKDRKPKPLPVPLESEILDIAKNGENQLYEFKGQRCEARKITREIAAMLNTRQGGIVFYGIDDDGNIEGSDISPQKLDQSLQNSVRNSILPAAIIRIQAVQVMGSSVIAIIVPPWNKKDVYQFDEKILIRKGSNVFAAKPEEVKMLHDRKFVV